MSSDGSIECISPSSNASWDILETEERNLDHDLLSDGELVTLCSICGQPSKNTYFHHESCQICNLCSSCYNGVSNLKYVPNCQHASEWQCMDDTLFLLDDVCPTETIVRPASHPTSQTGQSSPCLIPSNNTTSPNDASDLCPVDVNDLSISNEAVLFHLESQTGSLENWDKIPTKPNGPEGVEHRSIVANVIEALRLIDPISMSTTEHYQQPPTYSTIPASKISSLGQRQHHSPPSLATACDSLAANLRTSSNLSSHHTVSCNDSGSGSNYSLTTDAVQMQPRDPINPLQSRQRSMVQMMRTSCPSSECNTSPSLSVSPPASPPSPHSLSSSPLNVATKFLKSMVIHSAATLNNFDALPLNTLERPKPMQSSPPSLPPSGSSFTRQSSATFMDSADLIADYNPPYRLHVWDHSKFQLLAQPKPVQKVVAEMAAYNLR